MTYRLDEFGLDGMLGATADLRRMGADAKTLEDAADEIVGYLRNNLVDEHGDPACALVRLYKTHAYGDLPPSLQAFASSSATQVTDPRTRVLALISTAGEEPEWNDRSASKGHQAIALPDVSAVERYPMVAQLIAQLGVDVAAVVAPDISMIVESETTDYNVFYVERAAGSASIPAQDFVAAYGIRSAFGFGGLLPRGALYAVVLFSKVPVGRSSAQLFRSVALGVNLPLIAAGSLPLFRDA